jgi:hypothetical protein
MRHFVACLLGLAVVFSSGGCSNSKETAESEPELPDWLADADDDSPRSRKDLSGDELEEDSDELADDEPSTSHRERSGKLELKLQPGDRFPLRKVIDVELSQASLNGPPEISRRTLDMMLMIQVGEQVDDRTRLQVRYDRIKYVRDVAGEHLEYDSRQPPTDVPFALRMYHDMVKDGFSFWIDRQNRIVESDDFRTFLTRCLRNIPEDKRQQVLFEAEANTGETGITDFIDNSIGLLPYGYHRAGDSWEKTRNVTRPVPMVVENVYTLKSLADDSAVISIHGMVSPSTTSTAPADEQEVRVSVVGGQALGSCTVFRDTGLPRESRVETIVQMVVKAGQVEFGQEQKTITTIESYPAATNSRPRVVSASLESDDEPVEEEEEAPPRKTGRRNGPRLK